MFAYYIVQHASRLLMNAIFGSTSLYYTDRAKNFPIVRIERIDKPPINMMVVNEMQFSDRQLYLTGGVYLSIRTGSIVAFSDRVS